MVTWQMRSSLPSSRVIGITAFGRSSLSFFPLLRGRPLFLLPRWRSCVFWIGALAFADERCHYGVLRSPTSILRNSPQWFVRWRSWRCGHPADVPVRRDGVLFPPSVTCNGVGASPFPPPPSYRRR